MHNVGMPYGRDYDENGFPIEPEEPMSYVSSSSYSQVDDGFEYDTTKSSDVISVILLENMIDGEALDNKVFAPLEWVVRDVIPEGTGIIAGGPKLGKSWFVGGLALACAAGKPAFGRIPTEARPVLYLALEDPQRRLQDRYRKMLPEGERIPKELHSMVSVQPGKAVETIREYLNLFEGRKPLVIVDTLAKIKPHKQGNQESYLADYDFASKLKSEADKHPGSSLLIVHHTRKMGADDYVDALSGTNGISGAVDYVMVLQRKRNSTDAVVSITGRDVAERDLAFRRDGFNWVLSGDTVEASEATEDDSRSLSDSSYAVIDFISERWRNGEATSPAQVESKFEMKRTHGATLLKRLVEGEYIDKQQRGQYVPLGEGSI